MARILLTRPEGSNELLAERLRAQGHEVHCLPLMQIEALPVTEQAKQQLLNLDLYQHIIVTSQHAAAFFLEQAEQFWPQWPVDIQWWCLGQATRERLEAFDIFPKQPTQGHTSETLLEEPALQTLMEQRVLLVSGLGGRTLLEDCLTSRGARLDKLSLYQRSAVNIDGRQLRQHFSDWQPQAIVCLSGETLHQLARLGDNIGHSYRNTAILVPSERVGEIARRITDKVQVLNDISIDGQSAALTLLFDPQD